MPQISIIIRLSLIIALAFVFNVTANLIPNLSNTAWAGPDEAAQCRRVQKQRRQFERMCSSTDLRLRGACASSRSRIQSMDQYILKHCVINPSYDYGEIPETDVPLVCIKEPRPSDPSGLTGREALSENAQGVYDRLVSGGTDEKNALLFAQMVSLREMVTESGEHPTLQGNVAESYAKLINAIDMALLSQDVYNDTSNQDLVPPDYSRITDEDYEKLGLTPDDLVIEEAGYFSAIYKDADGNYVYVNRGTEPGTLRDWIQNARQGLGVTSAQYRRAMTNAATIAQNPSINITYTGHSLGGGLATAQALVTSTEAIVFNPAGVSLDTINAEPFFVNADNADELVDAYIVDGEFLDGINGTRIRRTVKVPSLKPPFYKEIVIVDFTTPSSHGTKYQLPSYREGYFGGRDYSIENGWIDPEVIRFHGLNYVLKGSILRFCAEHFSKDKN